MIRLIGLMAGVLLVGGVFWGLMHGDEKPVGVPAGTDCPASVVEKVPIDPGPNSRVPDSMTETSAPAPAGIEGRLNKRPGEESFDKGADKGSASVTGTAADGTSAGGASGLETEPETKAPEGRSWQVFWTPFRTKGSALGFISRIGDLTGLDLDVRQSGTGGYRVAFSYSDEGERRVNVRLIEERTRLTIDRGETL